MAAKQKIKVMVSPTLAGWGKTGSYKGKTYQPGEVYELPEDCLMYRTKHFGSVVPTFVREQVILDQLKADDDGTVIE